MEEDKNISRRARHKPRSIRRTLIRRGASDRLAVYSEEARASFGYKQSKLSKVSSTIRLNNWKLVYSVSFIFAVALITGALVYRHIENYQRYDLTASEEKVIAEPNSQFAKLLSYSSSKKTYTLNSAGFAGKSSSYAQVGAGDTSSTAVYGAKIPTNSRQGITVADKNTGLSFSISPMYKTMTGKTVSIYGKPLPGANDTTGVAHLVYPISGLPIDAIETAEANGFREDLMLNKSPSLNNLSLSYRLSLPNTLTARLEASGNIGIYSADPSLFGNISYGSSKDQQLVQEARTSGAKNNLLFELPAPAIESVAGEPSSLRANYSLKGDIVSINISNLSDAKYPLSIDPSIIDSASTLALGYVSGDASYISGGTQLATNNVSSGTLSQGWTESNNTNSTGYNGTFLNNMVTDPCGTTNIGTNLGASVAYNGYLYAMGGLCDNNSNSVLNIDYALICTGSNAGTAGCSSTAGTIGSWTATNPTNCLSQKNTENITAQAYNGYLYIFGGVGPGASVQQNVLQYAKINTSNGSVGSCTTESGDLSYAVGRAGSVIYDGYVYLIGGCDNTCEANTSYFYKTVQSALINADGSVASFNTLSASDDLAYIATYTVASYNGYAYAAPNCGSGFPGCTSATTNLQFAKLLSGGNISTWTNTDAFQAVNTGQSLVASDGYLYLFDGSSSFVTTNQYAVINSDGTIGAWNTTTSLPTGRDFADVAVYNNVLYVTDGSVTSGITYANDTIDAPLDPAGTANTPFTTINGTFPTGDVYSNSAVLNGYLYVLGSCSTNACSALSSSIYFSSINSSGSLTSPGVGTCSGVWCTSSTSNYTIGGAALVAYDGNLTILGGCTAVSSGSCTTFTTSDVYQKPATNGSLATWTSDSANLSSGRWLYGTAVYNNYVYILGGEGSSTSINNVAFAELSPTGGVVASGITSCNGGPSATWCDVSGNQLPHTNQYNSAFANNGYLYITGGKESGSSSPTTDIFVSSISSTGNLSCPSAVGSCTGAWATSSTAMPISGGVSAQGSFAYRGYVYVIGGQNSSGTALNSVYFAQLNSNGSIGSFSSTGSLNSNRIGGEYAFADGNLYAIGGENSSSANTSSSSGSYGYELMIIGSGGPGILGNSSSASTSAAAAGNQAIAYNGYIYDIGGCSAGTYPNCTAASSSITYALICTLANASTAGCSSTPTPGTTGTWSTATTGLPSGRYDFGAAVYNGYLYITGGCASSCTTPLGDTQSIQIQSSGNITGSWTNLASFSTVRFGHQEDIYNGYIYVLGGCSVASSGNCAASGDYLSDTQYAALSSTGGISGSWVSTNGFMTARDNFGSQIYDGYVYVMGGIGSSGDLNDVQIARLNSDGTITSGAWSNTMPLPQAIDSFAVVAYDGELYILGGNSSGALSAVDFADIGNDGIISDWQPTTTLSTSARFAVNAVVSNGYIFVPGGYDGGYLTSTPAAPIYSQPRVGIYSTQVDLTGATNNNPTLDDIVLTGTDTGNAGPGGSDSGSGSGGVSVAYALASDACTIFGTLTLVNLTNLAPVNTGLDATPVNNGCSGGSQSVYNRYVELNLNIDDSLTTSFPDASGNHTTLNAITVYYHPVTADRLTGGGTLINGVQQSLDAPP